MILQWKIPLKLMIWGTTNSGHLHIIDYDYDFPLSIAKSIRHPMAAARARAQRHHRLGAGQLGRGADGRRGAG